VNHGTGVTIADRSNAGYSVAPVFFCPEKENPRAKPYHPINHLRKRGYLPLAAGETFFVHPHESYDAVCKILHDLPGNGDEAIKYLMHWRKKKVEELAEDIQCSPKTIQRLRNGDNTRPGLQLMTAVCIGLWLPTDISVLLLSITRNDYFRDKEFLVYKKLIETAYEKHLTLDRCKQDAGEYERYRRDPETRKRYGREWRQIRARYIAAHPLCKQCQQNGQLTPAQEIHHILPLSQGGTHDEQNLMALCSSCHSGITLAENNRRRE